MIEPPLVVELSPAPLVEDVLRAFAGWRMPALLDSALVRGELGRYSFLTADPFETVVIDEPVHGSNPFARVREILASQLASTVPGLPPFQGGAVGLLSYELGRCFERLPAPPRDEFRIPAAVIGVYDWTLAWDHAQGRCWFIGQGQHGDSQQQRSSHARQRWEAVRQALAEHERNVGIVTFSLSPAQGSDFEEGLESGERAGVRGPASGVPSNAQLSPLPGHPGVFSNFTPEGYQDAVRRVIEFIRAGDIFQANLSQQLSTHTALPSVEMFLKLRAANPATFAGYFAHDDWAVLSSSPERFLQLGGREASTRPIKGTRQRHPVPEADLFTRDELRESSKDQAENVMIVDLLRNDLSRVCRPGTVTVPELCEVETYETVSHLVSEVRGTLRDGADFWDLLAAAFPGGSITGAPKIRAMEIISQLEQSARGPYCGCLFYHSFDGAADSNILIRTMTQRGSRLQFPAGGGIVVDSDPRAEYEETLHKAAGMLRAVGK